MTTGSSVLIQRVMSPGSKLVYEGLVCSVEPDNRITSESGGRKDFDGGLRGERRNGHSVSTSFADQIDGATDSGNASTGGHRTTVFIESRVIET